MSYTQNVLYARDAMGTEKKVLKKNVSIVLVLSRRPDQQANVPEDSQMKTAPLQMKGSSPTESELIESGE